MRLPFAATPGKYTWRTARHDLLAALVVTAISIPEGLGFAAIAGLPLVTGLYCALLGPVVYALLTSSRRLIVGADSATAALVAAGATAAVTVGTAEYGGAIAMLGVVTGILLIIMGYARFGFLADLISRPVLVGFLAGVGVQLMVGKFPEMLGVKTHGTLPQHLSGLFANFDSVNLASFAIAIIVLAIALGLHGRTRVPSILLSLIVATLIAYMLNVEKYGVEVIGALQAGLPPIKLPPLNINTVLAVLPAAFSIALVVLAQSSVTIRNFAAEHDEKVRINRDLIALGAGNIASALTSGFAINGSPPRSIAADQAGGKTSFMNVYMAGLIAIVLLFGTKLFEFVPSAALAAIVFVIGTHLVKIDEIKRIYHTQRTEFAIAMIALASVALLGVRSGIIIAIVISLMERLRRQYRPDDDVLLRDGKLSQWAEARLDPHHRHRSSPEGVLAYRFNGALFFENATYFEHRLRRAIRGAKQPVNYVIVDAGAIDDIDYTAASILRRLYYQLHNDDIKLSFSHVAPQLRENFDRFGITEIIGEDNIFATLKHAIKRYPSSRRTTAEMVKRLKLNPKDYIVIGGGVMEALKLRETQDVDMVVTPKIYNHFCNELGWKEYVMDDGKRMVSHNGYHLMMSYIGMDIMKLKRDEQIVDDIPIMSVKQLIKAKQRFGRPKDLADVKLLKEYQRDERAR